MICAFISHSALFSILHFFPRVTLVRDPKSLKNEYLHSETINYLEDAVQEEKNASCSGLRGFFGLLLLWWFEIKK